MSAAADVAPHQTSAGKTRVSRPGRDGRPAAVAYHRSGVPGALPVVLIHGVGLAHAAWAPQIAALAGQYDVIALDMPGHGGSDLPPQDARLSDYSDAVIAVLDALELPAAVVIGHSMGALVALEMALAFPDRVLGVAALNAVFRRAPEQSAAVIARARALADEGEEARAASHRAAVARWFGEPVPPSLIATATAVGELLETGDPVGYARTYTLFAASDAAHAERLAELKVPALFFTGAGDANSSPAMSREMARLAPRGRAVVLAEARHMMNLTHPEAVNAELLAFLGGFSAAPFDARAFRQALGAFVTGVTVVTTRTPEGELRGFTANSFTSVSLDPPLILVCIAKTASSYPVFVEARNFAVSVLAAAQKDVSALFASKSPDKFAQSRWRLGAAGNPVIEEASAFFDCTTHQLVDAGDHVILIGRVESFGTSPAAPLGYGRGAYLDFALAQEAVATREEPARVGAILERDGAVLMVEDGKGGLDLPAGTCLEPPSNPRSLKGALAGLGVEGRLGFLFAVFETPKGAAGAAEGRVSIYYRGGFEGTPQGAARLVPFDAIDFARLPDDATRSMLARYVKERREDAFGIYVGDAAQGTVHPLAAHA